MHRASLTFLFAGPHYHTLHTSIMLSRIPLLALALAALAIAAPVPKAVTQPKAVFNPAREAVPDPKTVFAEAK